MSSNVPGFKPARTTPDNRLIKGLAAYLPAISLPDPAAASPSFKGAVLVAEVEGFSALAESMVKLGREGAEALGRTLNNYFRPLIETINQGGGQVINLDGSGLVAFFPAHRPSHDPDHYRQAVEVAWRLLDQAAGFHPVQTTEGRYSLGMRAGLGQGMLEIIHLGNASSGWALVVQGDALHQANQAVQQAAWGEVVGWREGLLKPARPAELSGQSFTPDLAALFGDEDPASVYNRLSLYLPRVLAQKLKLSPETPLPYEFRRVVNVFVILPDLDLSQDAGLAVLHDYYGTLQRVCSGLDGRVHRIVPNRLEKSVNLHLTFGAIMSSSDDAEHALQAALAVRDLPVPSGALPAIGIASGSVYTGSIGTPDCQRFVVLGDVVKLSKQLAQAAQATGTGVLPVDRYTRERVGLSYIFGEDLPLNLPGQPSPVRTNPLLAAHPQPCNLGTFLKETTFVASPPADFPVDFEEVLAGEERVFVLSDAGQFYPLAQNWLKGGGGGASGACLPNAARKVPYLAWAGLLGGLIGLNDTDSRTEKAAKLSEAVSRFAPDYVEYSGWLSQLLGLAPAKSDFRSKIGGPQREQFSRFVIELLHGLAQTAPLLVIISDLQWIDEPGLYLLNQVVRQLKPANIFFCLTLQRGNPAVDSQIDGLPGQWI
jgi:class 3 adenylate cyclase